MTRVLICGSRTWVDTDGLIRELVESLQPEDVVIHGAAPGADTLAGILAEERGLEVLPFPAHWRHGPDCQPGCELYVGPGAGSIRNRQMLTEGRPDVVFAFTRDFASSRGTKDMVILARKVSVRVEVRP